MKLQSNYKEITEFTEEFLYIKSFIKSFREHRAFLCVLYGFFVPVHSVVSFFRGRVI